MFDLEKNLHSPATIYPVPWSTSLPTYFSFRSNSSKELHRIRDTSERKRSMQIFSNYLENGISRVSFSFFTLSSSETNKKIGVKKKCYVLLDGGKKGRGGRKKAVKKKKKKKKSTVNTLCLYPDGIFLKGGRALVEGRRKKEGAKYRVKITSLRGCRNGERERGGRV